MAEQADQREHRMKEGLSKLQPAFTAHHQKGVIFRLLIKKDLRRLTAHPHCPASKGVITSSDRALHSSAEAMPLAASGLPGTQCHLLTLQPAAQLYTTQPITLSLAAIPSTVVGPATNQLSHQPDQHQAASPHSNSRTNLPTQQMHL
jgi:hypothetical protein